MRKLLFLTILGCAVLLGLRYVGKPADSVAPGAPNKGPSEIADSRPIRFALTAAFVSENGVDVYEDIVDYIGRKLNRPCELVKGLSYKTVDSMLQAGAVDIAFICGLPYVIESDRPDSHIKLLVAPIMNSPAYEGLPQYYSYVIVHRESDYNSFESLRGCNFVYNDELSNSGYNMPRAHLLSLGETKHFFGTIRRSGSHEASIRMVASREADASCVDSLVLDFDRHLNDSSANAVKIIDKLGPAGIPPVVASTNLPDDVCSAIAHVFLQMHEDPRGREILDRALLKRFEKVADDNYDSIRRMKTAAESAGFDRFH
ncbi:MAG: PhnD/SsuA/transferrin family substrate-binding protein [Phycisphaerales bacterium]|nr:PhnD/SsuA/transferrin family substrate-binding protein [Phycisphaerales bacterium]MCB9864853.1 PhnD/SsuA/transferrin family substrate-binding protein [Phycisphaerales bacterium]